MYMHTKVFALFQEIVEAIEADDIECAEDLFAHHFNNEECTIPAMHLVEMHEYIILVYGVIL